MPIKESDDMAGEYKKLDREEKTPRDDVKSQDRMAATASRNSNTRWASGSAAGEKSRWASGRPMGQVDDYRSKKP